jgi:hypothetical protein
MLRTADKQTQKLVEDTLAQLGLTPYDGTDRLAYVNHGRWVADCACNGGELVAPGERMLCGSCGAWNTVTFPGPKTRTNIEAALQLRPPFHQNWYPDETVDELTAQNIENGIGVDL